jgi:hypothetical protein
MMLAGGMHEAEALIRFCKTPAAAKNTYCEPLAKLDPQRLGLRLAKTSCRDQRIRAFYILASGPRRASRHRNARRDPRQRGQLPHLQSP